MSVGGVAAALWGLLGVLHGLAVQGCHVCVGLSLVAVVSPAPDWLLQLHLALVAVGCLCAFQRVAELGLSGPCCTEKATPARHRPERQHNARSTRRKQCSPKETKPYSNPTPLRKRQTTPTNGHTPRRMKPTHTRLTHTRMCPHAPSHQASDHPVPAHTERHNPPKLRTQRQSGLPPRAASSQGQRHRCQSIRKQSV